MAASASAPSSELELHTEKNADETIVRGKGRITSASTELFQTTIRELIPGCKRIVLDLTSIDY
ncbi:MAG TPA: hypothetical protein VKU42_06020, partial [Candidatus Angelobacter sp.]|nr:hypothetical protein [Candidatus Angelobacter sp.]